RRVDVAVVEVGLGGRYDATNVLTPLAVALGPISLDHTSVLGRSVREIAGDKVGIFRPATPVVGAPQVEEAERAIQAAGEALSGPLWWVREEPRSAAPVCFAPIEWGLEGGRFDLATPRRSYRGLHVPLIGRHQLVNAATSVALIDAVAGAGLPV